MTPHPEARAHPASDSRPWVPAALIAVLAADIIDVVLVVVPLAVGVILPGPAWVRLVLIIVCPLALLHLLDCHGRRGRWAGGALLGLRTVDEQAGLPTGTPRGLIAQVALGHAMGATTVDMRRGPDPSRGPLGETPRIEPQSSGVPATQAVPRKAAWAAPQPRTPRPSDIPPPPFPPAPTAAAFNPVPAPPASQPPASSAPGPRSSQMDIGAPAPSAVPTATPSSLPPAVPPQPARPSAPPIPSPRYALRLRSVHGWTWLLSSPTIIGGATRQIPALAPHGTVDIPAMGTALSDNHAHLELLDGSLYLADLGSAGGTRIIGLNGAIQQCAPSTRYRIPLPCTIELGTVRLSAELERIPA
ncbi:FHA domain-containing protein [Actinomyces gaoshouyii]|uniref:FHA domain-containing protein n=1 Tax=Actinomyces gaoshouyii TaxID=1960083 RepID=UPI0009C0397B|nr:FHA domain-containing protein [Actinomyces gaoshouyii]ARD42544.1 hypothetical protein B6G06_09465 [Actinomyces gaoshouyii]